MTKQFNVGDTVKYTSPYEHNKGWTTTGTVLEINPEHFNFHGYKKLGYYVIWADGSTGWIAVGNLLLVKSAAKVEPTIKSAKELKAELQSEILRLIQDFNKKTNLEVQDIGLVCYKDTIGYCQQVNIKVEI